MPKIKSVKEMADHYNAAVDYFVKNWEIMVRKAIAENNWCKGIGEVTGKSCNPVLNEKWKKNLGAVSAEEFKASVEGKGEKLAARWEAKVTA